MRIVALVSSLSLFLVPAGSVAAQCAPAQYSTFGQGCAGTGSGLAPCLSANWNQTLSGTTGIANNFALAGNSGAQPLVVCSVDFFTATRTGTPGTTNVWIYDRPVAGGPPGAVLATSTMNVGGTPGVCSATITPPLLLLPNTDFFLVIDNRLGLRLPIATSGTLVTHYHSGPPNWSGPFNTQRWNWQVTCCAGTGAFPALRATGVPQLGGSYRVDLAQARTLTVAMLFTGYSNTSWNGIPLPLDLTPAGAPGCSLLAPGLLISVVTTDASGNATQPFSLPSDPTLCGGQLFQQWVVFDTLANTLGFAFSNGGAGTMGS